MKQYHIVEIVNEGDVDKLKEFYGYQGQLAIICDNCKY